MASSSGLQDLYPQAAKLGLRNGKVPIIFDKVPAVVNTKNDATPFISLPQEIKNDYELVLGGHLLHICTKSSKMGPMFYHRMCHASLSENAEQNACQEVDPEEWYVKGISDRHQDCYDEGDKFPDKVNISLLQICRRIFREARFIAFSFNTFAFSKASAMRGFIHQISQSTDFNLAVRSIHLDINYWTNKVTGLSKAIGILVARMKNLERISISINQPMNWSNTYDHDEKLAAMQSVFDCLIEVGRLSSLKSVTVVVSDKALENHFRLSRTGLSPFDPERRWRIGERREWADFLKQAIFANVGSDLADGN